MNHLSVIDTGLVYRNPMPHLRSQHAYFPSILELSPGELVAGFDLGTAFEAVDVRSFASRSSDGGKTWTEPIPSISPPASPAVSTSCRLAKVSANEIVGWACLFDRALPDEGLANPATDGFVRTEFATVRSTDGGKTFGPIQPVALPLDWHHFEICSPIIVTKSGRWLVPTSPWADWGGREPHGPKAMAFVSDDQGKSWTKTIDVMNRRSERIAFFEQKITTLSDGSLLALCWSMDLNAKQNRPNHFAISKDNGDSFFQPIPTPLLGETCTPVALDDQHILCVYRRMDKKGLWAHLARIENNQWKAIADLPLWGTNVSAHDTTQDSVFAQMSTLRFGCPSVTRLADGSVMAAFWCVEEGVSNIRWFKIATR